MLLLILCQHVLKNGSMAFCLTILKMGFRADCGHVYGVSLDKPCQLFGIEFSTCIHYHLMCVPAHTNHDCTNPSRNVSAALDGETQATWKLVALSTKWYT